MTKVKICGVRSFENALMVANAGADLLGLNFFPGSPRYIEPKSARELTRQLRSRLGADCPVLVGVFVNAAPDEVRAIVAEVGLDYAQLSGDETAATVASLAGIAFRAIRPPDVATALAEAQAFVEVAPTSEDAPSLLLDAYHPKLYGGTGETASADIALAVKREAPRLMLAGGLNAQNVAERVRAIRPWAVDVASGVEAGVPGIKDEDKARDFVAAVRAADA